MRSPGQRWRMTFQGRLSGQTGKSASGVRIKKKGRNCQTMEGCIDCSDLGGMEGEQEFD